jgi:ribosomal protein S18 acetylase RimI-like enzyme
VSWEIQPLTDRHDRKGFTCGYPWLDAYLRQHALRNQELGYGRSYVAVPLGASRVEGFYTLSMGSVAFANLPDGLAARVPKYPMPVAHMGCLAVRSDRQGRGLGGLLLIDALRRVVAAAEVIAARAVEVKAIDEKARDWYAGYGFLPFRDAPLHLYLPMQTVRSLVQAAE